MLSALCNGAPLEVITTLIDLGGGVNTKEMVGRDHVLELYYYLDDVF